MSSDSSDGLYLEEKENYKYWSKELIKKIGIEGVEQDLFVNIKRRSIISAEGIKYEGKEYYALNQIPEELYNVEYVNGNSGKPTFDISNEYEGNDKWKITISNVQYETGYIKKWQVKYKTDREIYWSTDDNLSFEVSKPGNYIIKLVNGKIESNEQEIELKKLEYVTDGLIRHFDGINNTGNGHSNNITTWKDLSGHCDGKMVNYSIIGENYLELDGKDDWVDIGQITDKNTITLEATVMLDSIQTGDPRILCNQETGGMALSIYEGKLRLAIYINDGYKYITSDEICKPNQKYHVLGTYDGKALKLYVDGELKKTYEIQGTIKNPEYNMTMVIGTNRNNSSFNSYANIKVYSARVYEKALSESEIKQNYEMDKKRFNIQ